MKIKHIEVNLGKVCNNKCRFCMTTEVDKLMFAPNEDVIKEVKAYARKGFVSLGFLGGEPTIYPKLSNVIRHARKSGFMEVHIVSNGRKYADRAFLEELVDAGATRFSVSIHSHVKKIEDYTKRIFKNVGLDHPAAREIFKISEIF